MPLSAMIRRFTSRPSACCAGLQRSLQRCGPLSGAAILAAASLAFACSAGRAQAASPLFARGYTVLPQPQQVSLQPGDFPFGSDWHLRIGAGVSADDVAVEALREDLKSRFGVSLSGGGDSRKIITLEIVPGSVAVGPALDQDKEELSAQAYLLQLNQNSVVIHANAATGLFYGVETFVQLLRPAKRSVWFPAGTIRDWPDLHMRHIYWDDNHHLERMDQFKRILRQAAFYKINGVTIKLNGHFEYRSASAAVEPYALTPAQLQQLTRYGLRYHVQIVPYLDGPAHLAFLLKHPEYSGLRQFPDSDYEICATNPKSYRLLEGVYQELIDATPGVQYFYLSTDEPYYLGMADNRQCNEKDEVRRLGSPGRLFAQFVQQTGGYLHEHGRQVIFWGEYPMKPADIPALPQYLINGEVYGPSFDRAFRAHGIQQMIYTSTEGEEKLFPHYFSLPQPAGRSSKDEEISRLHDIFARISRDPARSNGAITGSIDAGWGDEGVNPETFWLGYVASADAGWHPAAPAPAEFESSFYSLFYGRSAVAMDRIYRLMSMQAQIWSHTWDTVDSTARKPLFGSSRSLFHPRRLATDQSLPLPPAPAASLAYSSRWREENAGRLRLVSDGMPANDTLIRLLHEDMQRAEFNRYNLQVFLTVATLCRHNLNLIDGIRQMDADLSSASRLASSDPTAALRRVDDALDRATSIWQERNQMLRNSESVWYQAWYPRAAQANGRTFLHVLDDVKDHLPDRTVDLSYLIYREKLLPFGGWVNAVLSARNAFAVDHQLPARNAGFDWNSLQEAAPAR